MLVENNELGGRDALLVRTWIDFGRRVRELRQAQGLTQATLAHRLAGYGVDVHQTQIAKMESGARPTVIHEVWALTGVLDVGYDDLMPARPGKEHDSAVQTAQRVTALRAVLERETASAEQARQRVEVVITELAEAQRELHRVVDTNHAADDDRGD